MKIPSLGITIHLNQSEKDFLDDYFKKTAKFFETQDMLNSDNIGLYAEEYMEFLKNSEYAENDNLKLFYYELKASQLREKMIESGKIKLSPRQRLYRKAIPATGNAAKCKNSIINKWRRETRIVGSVSKADLLTLTGRLDPIVQENKDERILSFESSRKDLVGGKH